MLFLRIVDELRQICGRRQAHHFPKAVLPVTVIASEGSSYRTVIVGETALGKAVLESPCFTSHNFLANALRVADGEQTFWIRKFCEENPLMLEGAPHEGRREQLSRVFDVCMQALDAVDVPRMASLIEAEAKRPEGTSAARTAQVIVAFLFKPCFSALAGREVDLPENLTAGLDVLNPFPKPASLHGFNRVLDLFMERLDWRKLGEAERIACSLLLAMGVTPMLATLTAALNVLASSLQEHDSPAAAAAKCRAVDFHRVVPTNFVVRRCCAETRLGGQHFLEGDIACVFLGELSGCPLGRQNATPFGAGRHFCLGAATSRKMLTLAQDALKIAAPSLAAMRPSAVVQGKASPFLAFADA